MGITSGESTEFGGYSREQKGIPDQLDNTAHCDSTRSVLVESFEGVRVCLIGSSSSDTD